MVYCKLRWRVRGKWIRWWRDISEVLFPIQLAVRIKDRRSVRIVGVRTAGKVW